MKKYRVVLICVLTVLMGLGAVSCKQDEEDSNAYINDWIQENMDFYYLWNDKMPSNLDKTVSPDVYFKSLLYTYDATLAPDGDRFSWIQKDWTELVNYLSGVVEREIGFDYRLYLLSEDSENLVGQVSYVKKGTPAERAGIRRGMWFNGINGTILTVSNYEKTLTVTSEQVKLDLLSEVYESNGQFSGLSPKDAITFNTVASYAESPLYLDTIYTVGTQKVGYLVYNFFAPDAGDESLAYDKAVNQAVGLMKAAGVTHLVLDLRYNSGGYASSGVHLASMLVPTLSDSTLFSYYRFNSVFTTYLTEKYGEDYVNNYFTTWIMQDDQRVEPINALGDQLQGLYVITGLATASASEQLINGLKAYRSVVLIGETTYGKNMASISIYEEDDPKNTWGMQPISLALSRSLNAVTVPIRQATGVFDKVIMAPSSTALSATFQAMDMSLSAPKMIPRFPFNKPFDIISCLIFRHKITQSNRKCA